jgi:RecA-family ATPase
MGEITMLTPNQIKAQEKDRAIRELLKQQGILTDKETPSSNGNTADYRFIATDSIPGKTEEEKKEIMQEKKANHGKPVSNKTVRTPKNESHKPVSVPATKKPVYTPTTPLVMPAVSVVEKKEVYAMQENEIIANLYQSSEELNIEKKETVVLTPPAIATPVEALQEVKHVSRVKNIAIPGASDEIKGPIYTNPELEEIYRRYSNGEIKVEEGKPVSRARRYDSFVKAPKEWVWKNYLVKKGLNMVTGPSGSKKTFLTIEFIKHVTTGTPWHDGTPCELGNAIIVNVEDDIETELIKRFEDSGANLRRIFDLSIVDLNDSKTIHDPAESPFQLPRDIAFLASEIKDKNASLVILDNIGGIIPDNANPKHVRAITNALAVMCKTLDTCIVLINHINKGVYNPKNGATAIKGASDWTNAVRSSLFLTPDDSNPIWTILKIQKSNVAPSDTEPMKYCLKTVEGKTFIHWHTPDNIESTSLDLQHEASISLKGTILYMLHQQYMWYEGNKNNPLVEDCIEGIAKGDMVRHLSKEHSEGAVTMCVQRLFQEGHIERAVTGWYILGHARKLEMNEVSQKKIAEVKKAQRITSKATAK